MNEIEQQLREYERQIAGITDHTAQTELRIILNNCRRLFSQISREAVECRRHNRPSMRYRELADEFTQQTETLEMFILQATLTYL